MAERLNLNGQGMLIAPGILNPSHPTKPAAGDIDKLRVNGSPAAGIVGREVV